ncbi:MAG: hypothetical protein IPO17_15305 [Flavobacteriales bacterium]|nr:hypothetical protein [Flavobacteriales bacterium]
MKCEMDLTGMLAKQAELAATIEGGGLKARLDREIIAFNDSLRGVRSQIMQIAPVYFQDLGLPMAFDLQKVRGSSLRSPSFLLVQHLIR